MPRDTRKITILHSNDMHGDFLAESREPGSPLIGGLALLAGYINRVRKEEKTILYAIAGDMLQGSVIDAEFRGISTIEIMNYLAPDVATLGNHELDYGLPHLLFLEKMANFPILNANMYIRKYHKRLMRPHLVLSVDGFDVLFIGVITEMVLDQLRKDQEIATFITLEEASTEVGKICNAYRDEDIDLTVLLTHIGFESDKKLAALLRPEWGVDIIIGGHSHTILEKPEEVNGILIAQAGVGTDQIGRFDIVVDDETNSIVEYRWQLLPISSSMAEPDQELQKYIESFKEAVDRKYNTIVCRLAQKLTHPRREEETSLGNLFADIIAQRAGVDVALVGSGSIRVKELGPLVTLGEFRTALPFQEPLHRLTLAGAQLKRAFQHVMRPENRTGEGECFQVSRGVKAVYVNDRKELQSLTIHGRPVEEEGRYTIVLQDYQYQNPENLGLSEQDWTAIEPPQIVATSDQDVVEEYLRAHQNLNSAVEGRLEYR